MKQHLFKNGLICGLMTCALALTACSSVKEAPCEDTITDVVVEEETPVYLTEHYVETHEVLPESFSKTVETSDSEISMAVQQSRSQDLALSRPATLKGTPVKDKEQELQTKKEIAVSAPVAQTTTQKTATKTTTTQTITSVKKKNSIEDRVSYGEEVHDWSAVSGETLRSLLMQWGEKSGWTVVWKLDRDYHLEAGVVFRGKFTEVASALVRSFARATPAPIGTFYRGNRVLVISTQEDENAN